MGTERFNKDKRGLHCLSADDALSKFLLFGLREELLNNAGYPRCSVRISRGVICALAPTDEDVRHGQTSDVRLTEMLLAAWQAIGKLDYQKPIWEFDLRIKGGAINLLAYQDHTKGSAIHIVTPSEF